MTPAGRGRWYPSPHTGLLGSRAYHVYVPRGLRRTTQAPLVVALHGCSQTALEFAALTRFNQLADRHQFIVVYPDQARTSNGQRCWNWHQPGSQFRHQGEPAILAGIVRRIIADRSRWRIDPNRVYAAGLSAGGAMAATLGVSYPELFAAVGVHSAPPYRSAVTSAQVMSAMQGRRLPPPPSRMSTHPMPPTIIFHGSIDGTVWPVNAKRIAEQWIAHYQRDPGHGQRAALGPPRIKQYARVTPVTAGSRRGYSVQRWSVGRRRLLELWLVDGLAHAWSGGGQGVPFSDRRGPRASTEMWRFFATHSLATVG